MIDHGFLKELGSLRTITIYCKAVVCQGVVLNIVPNYDEYKRIVYFALDRFRIIQPPLFIIHYIHNQVIFVHTCFGISFIITFSSTERIKPFVQSIRMQTFLKNI